MNLNALKVDPEFQGKIPPLTFEELNQLEANILRDGRIINPIIVWEELIVDGHNRFTIAKKHPEIPFTVHEKEFANRYEAIIWICKNQLGRRNLTPEQKSYLIGKQYEAEKHADFNRGNQYTSSKKSGCYQNGNSQKLNRTCERIASENGIGRNTVIRAEQFAKGVDAAEEAVPGTRQKVLSGEVKPTAAEIASVARAPPEERPALVAAICKAKEPKPLKPPAPKQKTPPAVAAPLPDASRKQSLPCQADCQWCSDALRGVGCCQHHDTPLGERFSGLSRHSDRCKKSFCCQTKHPESQRLSAKIGGQDMNNMNCVSTMPEIMPEITDEAIIEALFAQRPYEEKVINSAFLEIPAEYQRDLNLPNVEKMSAEFTELIANPPKVSYRDGHYYVFDGQHTLVTRKSMNGGADLPIICKVYTGLTKEEEAILFSKQTGVSRPLTAGAELRAALVGKDAESIAFLNATESTGLQLGLDNYRAQWKIVCIRTAFKEYKTYGADLYKEALTMLARGWEGDPDSLRSGILRGMVRFVALYQGEYDPERLVKRLHTIHPMTLVRDEKSLSGTVSYKYMMLILRTYNGSSRRFNLPIKQ